MGWYQQSTWEMNNGTLTEKSNPTGSMLMSRVCSFKPIHHLTSKATLGTLVRVITKPSKSNLHTKSTQLANWINTSSLYNSTQAICLNGIQHSDGNSLLLIAIWKTESRSNLDD